MKEFIFLGLSENQGVQKIYFVVFLLFYTLTVAGNLLTVTSSWHLNSPLYFFLCHLSFVDVFFSSVTDPQMISGSLVENNTISFAGCIGQLFGLHFFGCTEVFTLTATAYDRHVPICQPLHCPMLVSRPPVWPRSGGLLGGGLMHAALQTLPTALLPFCGPNKVTHYFCDAHPLLRLARADTRAEGPAAAAGSGVTFPGCFLILVMSCVVILLPLRGQTLAGRHSPHCGSHSTVVMLCLGPARLFTSACPVTSPRNKNVAFFCTLITPMFNPFIYSLWNGEVRGAMQ
ncbi:OR4S2 protein, partial [Hylia prasina]|nr:OR4S2 protein [Hylia prasina]